MDISSVFPAATTGTIPSSATGSRNGSKSATTTGNYKFSSDCTFLQPLTTLTIFKSLGQGGRNRGTPGTSFLGPIDQESDL